MSEMFKEIPRLLGIYLESSTFINSLSKSLLKFLLTDVLNYQVLNQELYFKPDSGSKERSRGALVNKTVCSDRNVLYLLSF